MILCVTPNAAIDRTLRLTALAPGEVHRAVESLAAAGGKGINVARAVTCLGGQAICAGFLGGHSGRLVADLAAAEGLRAAWTWFEGETRTCIILADPRYGATVINESGSRVTDVDWARLRADVLNAAEQAACVCISGSLPPGSPLEAYTSLLRELQSAGKPCWVDASGAPLRAALEISGVHVKINGDEAGEILGTRIATQEDALAAGAELLARGVGAAVLTLGAAGAVIFQDGEQWAARPPLVEAVSAVGSGDSFLAGLALSLVQGHSPAESLRRAVAAGAANTLTIGGGQFTPESFERVLAGTTLQQFSP